MDLFRNCGLFCIAALCITACVTPDDVPEYQSRIKAAQGQSKSTRVIPPSFRFQQMPIKPGHYTRYLISQADTSEPFLYRLEVIQAGDLPFSYWFESEVIRPNRRTLVRTLALLDEARLAVAQRAPESFAPVLSDYNQILQSTVWSSDAPALRNYEGDAITKAVPWFGKLSQLSGLKTTSSQKMDVRAGKFKCFRGTSEASLFGLNGPLKSCLDSQVPLNGLVQAVDSARQTWELVDFGINGSQTVYPSGVFR